MGVSGLHHAPNNEHAHSSALHINSSISPPGFLLFFGIPSLVQTAHLDRVCSRAINWLSRAAVQKLVEPTRHRREKRPGCTVLFGGPHDASVSAGGALLVLLRAGRLRAENREHRGRPESEEIRAGLQRCRDPGQPGVRQGQIQADCHLRNAQTQRHPDGSLRLRGPHLQSGSFTLAPKLLPH